MSDWTVNATLNLRCLVEIVSALGGSILDEAAALSEQELHQRIQFLRDEVEDRLAVMSPPSPPPNRYHNRLDPDDLPF